MARDRPMNHTQLGCVGSTCHPKYVRVMSKDSSRQKVHNAFKNLRFFKTISIMAAQKVKWSAKQAPSSCKPNCLLKMISCALEIKSCGGMGNVVVVDHVVVSGKDNTSTPCSTGRDDNQAFWRLPWWFEFRPFLVDVVDKKAWVKWFVSKVLPTMMITCSIFMTNSTLAQKMRSKFNVSNALMIWTNLVFPCSYIIVMMIHRLLPAYSGSLSLHYVWLTHTHLLHTNSFMYPWTHFSHSCFIMLCYIFLGFWREEIPSTIVLFWDLISTKDFIYEYYVVWYSYIKIETTVTIEKLCIL